MTVLGAELRLPPLVRPMRLAETTPRRALLLHRDLLFGGGVPQCFLSLARMNDPHRLSISVASCMTPPAEMVDAFHQASVEPVCIGDRGLLRPARRLRRLVRRERIEVVVTTSFKTYQIAKLALVGLDLPIVFWVHASQNVIVRGWRRAPFRWFSRNDALVFVSDAVRRSHAHYSHRGIEQVVYNGVTDPFDDPSIRPYEPCMRPMLGVPEDAIVLGYTASFVPWKDHDTLLSAFERLDHTNRPIHLVLIGSGDLEPELRRRAASMRYGRQVHFLGLRTDARRLLGLIDLYVHTCREEGFGLAVVEAMLAGKPVVAAREGAIPEYLRDGMDGLLFMAADPDDLADRITAMIDDPAAAASMGRSARSRCLRLFSPRRYYDSICEVIERVAQPS